ncbi:hypothetical protein [Bradyrhizobium australafricanum]|uniref:hypothetical protein n=1 Tax=Bradyrhizobium australafricanum TaxID=2821406 RepID=UPI001CE2A0D2|nr:hypothetical protein [Bradyrhizobium australafricanum]MCA6098168.1 hypothetical protein [Bradyrhizobium australafricanum]
MLYTPPPSLNDATAAPRAALDALPAVAPNARIRGGGLQTILPGDIPCPDDGKPVPYEAPKPRKLFAHRPVITRRIGDKIEVVTGPVKPVVPHTDATTAEGWKRYFDAEARAKAATIAKAKQVAEERKAFFKAREDGAEAKYQDRCKKALEKGRPLPKRPEPKDPPPNWENYIKDPELLHHILGARSAKQRKERIRRAKLSGRFAGRNYAPVVETFQHEDGTPAPAIRGWLGLLSFQLFNSALEKGRGVTYGNDKTAEFSGMERIWALDGSYVVKDKCRCTGFVVDLDGWTAGMDALRAKLRTKFPIEFMPNIITHRGREEDGAGVDGAHLEWLLPPGSRVLGFTKKSQRELHKMIQKAIVNLLIDIGADGGHTNINKTKNCLSVGWSAEVCDDYFQTMEAWRAFLPTLTCDRRDMIRRTKLHKAEQQTGADPKESLAIWNDGIAARRLCIKTAQATQDPAYLAAVRKCRPGKVAPFVDWLYSYGNGVVTQRLVELHGDTKAVRAVIAAQREYVLELGQTPDEIGEFSNRGRDAKANDDLAPLPPTATAEERKTRRDLIKGRAGTSTQQHKERVHRGLIAEAIERRLSAGVAVVKSEIVKELINAGICARATAYDHFDDVLLVVRQAARYQVRPSDPIPSQPSQPVESSPVTPSDEPVTVDPVTVPPQAVRIPAQTTNLPAWVVDKDSLTEWQEACLQRDDWAVAVAAWRAAKARRRPAMGSTSPTTRPSGGWCSTGPRGWVTVDIELASGTSGPTPPIFRCR